MADLSRRRFTPGPASPAVLPFIEKVRVDGKKQLVFWSPPDAMPDYRSSVELGHQYACDFTQYLKDNRVAGGGILKSIADAMPPPIEGDDAPERGIAAGFWTGIELILRGDHDLNHWEVIQNQLDYYEILAEAASANCSIQEV